MGEYCFIDMRCVTFFNFRYLSQRQSFHKMIYRNWLTSEKPNGENALLNVNGWLAKCYSLIRGEKLPTCVCGLYYIKYKQHETNDGRC